MSTPQQSQSGSPRGYDVGYKKPPEHTRFQKGRSGNPKGRPKGSKNLITLIDRELDRRIPLREDGRSRVVPAREALAKRLVHKGLSGHDRSIDLLLKLAGTRAGGGAVAFAEAADSGAEALTAGGRAILEAYSRRTIEEYEIASRAAGGGAADEQGGGA